MEWMFLFFSSLLWTEIKGSGKIWLKLISFNNNPGKGANGHYCDGKFFFRGSDCDHRFILCVDDPIGPRNTNECAYGRERTVTVFDTNHITFGSTFGGLPNPMTFSFNKWMGSCKLKIDIYDDDDNRDDFVDYVETVYSHPSPLPNGSEILPYSITLQHRITMDIEMNVYCDPNYYGNGCDIYCKQTEKYTCSSSGTKICSDVWTGADCNVLKDACITAPCKNNATCRNSIGSFMCICQKGYSGQLCETNIDDCVNSPCLNGGVCFDKVHGFECKCANGYTGKTCKDEIDECAGNPCLNNGSCYDLVGAFICYCNDGWTGNVCNQDVDECHSSPCNNGGICVNTNGSFYCDCLHGWDGPYCHDDVNECEVISCKNGGNCSNYDGGFKCDCPDGFNGTTCAEDINECLDKPCKNGATCINTNGSFSCSCPFGYTGYDCSDEIDECMSSPCHDSATCIDKIGYFRCICPPQLKGHRCDERRNPCENVRCPSGRLCVSSGFSYKCCKTGLFVEQCHQDVMCNGSTDEITIYFNGKLTKKDIDDTIISMKEEIKTYAGQDVGPIEFTISSKWLIDNTSTSITGITLSLVINGTNICGKDLEILKTMLSKEDNPTYTLYYGDASRLRYPGTKVGKQHMIQEEEPWLQNNWYLLPIVVVLLVSGFGAAYCLLIHYKRKKKITGGEEFINNSVHWNTTNGTSNTLPQLAFDNDLYQSALYGEQTTFQTNVTNDGNDIPRSSGTTPTLAFENDIYQTSIPEEQKKLMTYDCDRFDDDDD